MNLIICDIASSLRNDFYHLYNFNFRTDNYFSHAVSGGVTQEYVINYYFQHVQLFKSIIQDLPEDEIKFRLEFNLFTFSHATFRAMSSYLIRGEILRTQSSVLLVQTVSRSGKSKVIPIMVLAQSESRSLTILCESHQGWVDDGRLTIGLDVLSDIPNTTVTGGEAPLDDFEGRQLWISVPRNVFAFLGSCDK